MLVKKFALTIFICLALVACDSSEERAEAFYQRGLELVTDGDPERARVEFRNALKQDATHLDARLQLARLQYQAGEMRPAFREFVRVAEQDPENLEAQITLSKIAFSSQDWTSFDRHSSAAVELAADDPSVRILDLASRYRNAVLEEDSPLRSSLVTEAEALEAEYPNDEILRQLLIDGYMFEEKFDAALEQLEKAIAATPDRQDIYVAKIQLLASLNELDAVEDELHRLVETFPEEPIYQENLLRFLMSRGDLEAAEAFLRDQIARAPEDDMGHIGNLVQFLLRTGKEDVAVAELEAAIAAKPDAAPLRALRASMKFDNGQRDEAIADMQALLDAQSEGVEDEIVEQRLTIKATLAAMLTANGNEVGARRLVEEILAEDENVVSALKMQARWMIEEDDPEGAINAMRTALAVQDQDSEAMIIMAEAYNRLGNKDLMLDFMSLAVDATNNAPEESILYANALVTEGRLVPAETTLVAALRVQPDNTSVLTALGDIYLRMEDPARTQQVINSLERIDTDQARAESSRFKLALLSQEANTDEVMAFLKNLADQNENNIGIKLTVVQTMLRNGDTEGARTEILRLVDEDPGNPTLAYFQGLIEAASGNIDTSYEIFQTLTKTTPNAELAWIQLARLQAAREGSAPAVVTLDKGLEANPGAGNLLWSKASLLQEMGDIDGAIEIYETLYEANSSAIIIANNLASLLATFRDDEESLERARIIARRLKGTEVNAFQDTYGWIQHRSGNSEEALTYLEPAAKSLTEDARVQYHLGVVYEAIGERENALTQMRLALEKAGPLSDQAFLDDIRARIAALQAEEN